MYTKWERRGEYGLEIWEYQPPEPAVEGEEDAGDDGSGWLSVCTVHQPGEANAKLIVHAPALLEALERTIAMLEGCLPHLPPQVFASATTHASAARAIIEAAKRDASK